MKKLLFAALLLSGCVMSNIAATKPIALSAAQMAQIKSTVTRDFFDPGSAQFRNVRAADITTTDGISERRVCGEVNGKNRMGGYVGFKMFGGKIVNGQFKAVDFFGPCEPF